MNLFYSNKINIENKEIILTDQENIHLTKVLRKGVGDEIKITDGKGNLYNCKVILSSKTKTILNITGQKIIKDDSPKLKIGISLIKKLDRFEWFLEKATEIGVSEITPLISRYTERDSFNIDRSNKLMISAMKQSLRYKIPKLSIPVNFNDYIYQKNFGSHSYIGTCKKTNIPLLKDKLIRDNDTNVLIGPEGGFSETEIDLAKKANFTPISLGKNRLRTETAGVFVCSIFSIIN